MEKDLRYFVVLAASLLLGFLCNILCLTGMLPYSIWRWSLAVIVVLLAAVWLLAGRQHREDPQFDPITTRPRRIVAGSIVVAWCISFFFVIFLN